MDTSPALRFRGCNLPVSADSAAAERVLHPAYTKTQMFPVSWRNLSVVEFVVRAEPLSYHLHSAEAQLLGAAAVHSTDHRGKQKGSLLPKDSRDITAELNGPWGNRQIIENRQENLWTWARGIATCHIHYKINPPIHSARGSSGSCTQGTIFSFLPPLFFYSWP